MQRGPETISRAGEVMAGCRGVQAGIDAAEEDFQARCDQIWYSAAERGRKIGLGGASLGHAGTYRISAGVAGWRVGFSRLA
jgi:hypothetical protein